MKFDRRSLSVIYENEVINLTELSKRTGIPYDTLRKRLDNGWPFKKAITQEVRIYEK